MTKKPNSGTISTIAEIKKRRVAKVQYPEKKARELLKQRKVRFTKHAAERMSGRNVILAEVLQAILKGRHNPKRDRFNEIKRSWAYSLEGYTIDDRLLRIGISFGYDHLTNEILLIITVIDL